MNCHPFGPYIARTSIIGEYRYVRLLYRIWLTIRIYGYVKTPDDWALATWGQYDDYPYWIDLKLAWEVAGIVYG